MIHGNLYQPFYGKTVKLNIVASYVGALSRHLNSITRIALRIVAMNILFIESANLDTVTV